MSKSLQEQLDYAHEQFDYQEKCINDWAITIKYDPSNVNVWESYAEESIEQAEMWLSIINSLTLLVDQESENAQCNLARAISVKFVNNQAKK